MAAREYCNTLMREGKLLQGKQVHVPTLKEYAEDFWDMEKSPYLKSRKGRRLISIGYVKNGKTYTDNQLLPYFGDMRLDRITEIEIENWITGFADRKLSNGTANNVFNFLSLMIGFAVKHKVVKSNPCLLVQRLKKDQKKIEILTPIEVRAMFPARWSDVWDDYSCYVINKLAACTGMRIGEIMGLRSEYVHEGYLEVCRQFSQTAGYSDVKTHKPRNIPVYKMVEDDLRRLIEQNGEGFVFVAKPHAEKPMSRTFVIKSLFKAMAAIKIDEKERQRRNLSFHSWRHFFNTTLLMANVTDTKVMAITGHVTEKMKENYTHFDSAGFTEVTAVQESLMGQRGRGKAAPKEDKVRQSGKARSLGKVEPTVKAKKRITAK
jgi:integrase